MDKGKKLKRYSRKDYTQLVDFPVEIVGRDGIIRRYSFEASVRLYQRRIASAPSRYGDNDVVTAEIAHCQRRIEQLRKSYFHRYGWSGIQRKDEPGGLAGQFAGEVAAFLRRFYGEQEPVELEVRWMEDRPDGQTYFARKGEDVGYLLYLYRFESFAACAGREAFFDLLRVVQATHGQDVETLVAFHHTADCGLVLTCMGEHAAGAVEADRAADEILFSEPERLDDPYASGLRLLSEGDAAAALSRFEAAISECAFRRQALVAACVVADMLGRPDSAETSARIGVHNFPDDRVLRYHLALSLVRGGSLDDGLEVLEQTLKLSKDLGPARLLRALVWAHRGDQRAPAELAAAERTVTDVDGKRLAARVRRALHARKIVCVLVPLTLVAAALTGWFSSIPLGIVAVTLSAASIATALVARAGLAEVLRPRCFRIVPPEGLGARGPRMDDVVL